MSQYNNGELIEAAGGLVWREDVDGKKIVLVHRKNRYGARARQKYSHATISSYANGQAGR